MIESELTSIWEVYEDEIRALEISIRYLSDGIGIFPFIHYYLYRGKFITFTVTGIENDMERFVNIREYD